MGNPTYAGSLYSSSRSGSSQSSTLTRETSRSETTPVKHKKSGSSQFLAWVGGGSAAGAELRKTTTTILEPTGETVIHQGRPVQLHSAKRKETMEWVRPPKEKAKDGNSRKGSSRSSGGTHRPEPPRASRQPGYNVRAPPAAMKSAAMPPPPRAPAFEPIPPRAGEPRPPPPPAFEPIPPQGRGPPPAQRRNPY